MPIIEIKNLSKTYKVYQKQEGLLASVRGLFHREHREVHAVSDINLTVEEGEFVAFLGPNGAGKTTTLRMLLGIIEPDEGVRRVFGHDNPQDIGRLIGYLPEERGLYPAMKLSLIHI